MIQWAVRLPRERTEALGALRLMDDVQVLADGNDVFVRGTAERHLPAQVRSLPGRLFLVLPDCQLVEHGRNVPTAVLPSGCWRPLAAWLTVRLPQSALDAEPPPRVALRVNRAGVGRGDSAGPPNVLLTTLQQWADYADAAPATRLQRCRFAADRSRRVVLHGSPLPPLVGTRYVASAGVAVEAGYTWSPPLDAEVIAQAYQLLPGDLLLLSRQDSAEHFRAEQFAPGTRSAVRLTAASLTEASDGAN